ncbi:Uncharacterised protein [Mycobacterium tuberculosis]|uniref:Uncharacterized protein n=1 Tax=Mycobacterium tuberculosis TaxID=1773 RepID=A0A655F656_MYCTX|nr:Uncharacterised protein [Mycobacterium tuberculosis]CKT29620.1 Uncharacterised protein [Mycobacterium tuberculosis]CNM49588.1 Uncharacterised protein [Mycobacterium tuberculosis]CNV50515.1 Uncharacterised protein [Mycobacterium tuberculosis]CNV51582.1 Uncharacterised protein [Mycobacterium tuberculosis]
MGRVPAGRRAFGGGLRLHRGRDGPERRHGAAPRGDRLQAGRRARAGLLRHRSALPPGRAAGQDANHVPRLLPAPGCHRRGVRPRRLLPDRGHHGQSRPRPVRLPRPPQQRAKALPGRVHRRVEARGGVRRQPAGPTDLHLRQQCPGLPAGGGCPVRGRAFSPWHRESQARDQRVPAGGSEGGRPAILRDSTRLHHRNHAVHPGERPAHRHPQAGTPAVEEVLWRTSRAALYRAGR